MRQERLAIGKILCVAVYTAGVSLFSVVVQSFVARLSTALGTFWSLVLLPLFLGVLVLVLLLLFTLARKK